MSCELIYDAKKCLSHSGLLLFRPLLSQEWFEGTCPQAVSAPSHFQGCCCSLHTLPQGPQGHHIPQRQSPEAMGHSGRSQEKNLLPLCPPVFNETVKAGHYCPSFEEFSLEGALLVSVCSTFAHTKELRQEMSF